MSCMAAADMAVKPVSSTVQAKPVGLLRTARAGREQKDSGSVDSMGSRAQGSSQWRAQWRAASTLKTPV